MIKSDAKFPDRVKMVPLEVDNGNITELSVFADWKFCNPHEGMDGMYVGTYKLEKVERIKITKVVTHEMIEVENGGAS